MKQNRVKFTTTVNEELLQQIKIRAVMEKRSVADIIDELFEKYLRG